MNEFTRRKLPATDSNGPFYWMIFQGSRLVVNRDGQSYLLHPPVPNCSDPRDLGFEPLRTIHLGVLDVHFYYAAEIAEQARIPCGLVLRGLRDLLAEWRDDHAALAGYASQIVTWDKTHRYCGGCGTQTRDHEHERAKICPGCGLTSFPRISPAVIVSVRKGDYLLLIHAHRHRSGVYSNVAGFVESGETLERCVRREIREEAGIEVRNIRYFGSQSWPFPHSLMVGFTAEYAGGKISPDNSEIADARWFRIDDMPPIPDRYTISRRLIDHVVSKIERQRSMSPPQP